MNIIITMYTYIEKRSITKCFVAISQIIKLNIAKFVKIEDEDVRNMANYTELRSFSSHCDYRGLLDFYSSLQCNKLALVHGNQDDKIKFAKVLQDKFVEQGKSTRVLAVQQGTKIYF
mgnify:CR=1 FL=1